jgi:hypothetical protein
MLVILQGGICHQIADAKRTEPKSGAASVIYNEMCRKNTMCRIIALATEICNTTCLIRCQRVRSSVRGVRALTYTRVFVRDTYLVPDGLMVPQDCVSGPGAFLTD